MKAAKAGKLNPAGARQITAEQMELSRLRAQVARLEMELEITKKAAAYFSFHKINSLKTVPMIGRVVRERVISSASRFALRAARSAKLDSLDRKQRC